MKNNLLIASLITNSILIVILIVIGLNNLNKKDEIKKDETQTEDKKEAKIILFGDSITRRGKWNELLKDKDVKNSGFGGFTTSHFRWLIQDNVIAYNPKICFLEGGINDIGVGIPLKRIKLNYKCLIDTLLVHNITPIVQSTLYQEDNAESKIIIDSLNSYLVDYCQQKSIIFLDLNAKLSTNKGLKSEYSLDGTHLKENAYLVWRDEINKVLYQLEGI